MKGTIITSLLGGLGNQMFQYAVGRRIAEESSLDLLVDTSVLTDHGPGRHAVNRHLDLDIFSCKIRVATRKERRFLNAHGLSFAEKAACRIYRKLSPGSFYFEKSFRYDPGLVERERPPRYIAGLWQSYRYFETIEALIRKDFSFRDPLPPHSAPLAASLSESTSVCLNVRRGDYVNVPATANILGFIGMEYYRRAVDLMTEKIGATPKFHVFSDDLEWCAQKLGWLGPDTVFVDHRHAGPKFGYYLHLMSLAANFIIPNSTFAWWAAWLSEQEKKTVIAPARWFADPSLDTSDLCPPDWIRI